MDNKTRLRNSYIINPSFQKKMISHLISLTVSINAFFFCAFYASSLYPEMKWPIMFAATFLSILTAGLWGLLLSNKIAGPIYRLNKYFKDASESIGKNQELSFRDGDYFNELTESINVYLFQNDLIALEDEPPQFHVEKKAS